LTDEPALPSAMPEEYDRPNWGAVLWPWLWPLVYGAWGWFWLFAALLVAGPSLSYGLRVYGVAPNAPVSITITVASGLIWWGSALRLGWIANRLVWQRNRQRATPQGPREQRDPVAWDIYMREQRNWVIVWVGAFLIFSLPAIATFIWKRDFSGLTGIPIPVVLIFAVWLAARRKRAARATPGD
jgi:hypothetical protein